MDTQDSGQHRSVGASGWLLRVPRPTGVQGLVCTSPPGSGWPRGTGHVTGACEHLQGSPPGSSNEPRVFPLGRERMARGGPPRGRKGARAAQTRTWKASEKSKAAENKEQPEQCEAQGRPWPGGETARRPASCHLRRKRLGAGRLEGRTPRAPRTMPVSGKPELLVQEAATGDKGFSSSKG